jgi:hypothetical protein
MIAVAIGALAVSGIAQDKKMSKKMGKPAMAKKTTPKKMEVKKMGKMAKPKPMVKKAK